MQVYAKLQREFITTIEVIRQIIFLTLLLPAFTALSQQTAAAAARADSVHLSLVHYTDSLNRIASMQWLTDSLTINTWATDMRGKVASVFTEDSLSLQTKIDSLSALNLSPEPYASRLDSLMQRRQNLLAEVNGTQQKLLNQTKSRLYGWQQKVQARLDSMNISGTVPGVNLPARNELSLPGPGLPDIPSLSASDFILPELSSDLALLNYDLGFSTPQGLNNIQSNLPGMEQVSSLRNFIGDPATTAQAAVGELDAVKKLQEQMNGPDPLPLPASGQDVKKMVIDKAVDHFAGQEDKLREAMKQVATYKQKYPSVQSLHDLPRRPPNPMKAKPFIERLVPGLTFQYQYKNAYLLDLNLYSGYRLTGRITSGLGWNQRLARDEDNTYWKHQAHIYGPRVFGSFELGEGFMAYLETEVMNTFVPIVPVDPNTGAREWVWGMSLGIKKSYTIYRNLRGTVFALYNVFDPHHKAPYVDRLNMRIGFEYAFRKKQKAVAGA